jgi:hypothetical protein
MLNRGKSIMKIGFICPNLPDHISPMSALERHLLGKIAAGGMPPAYETMHET